MAEDDVDLLLQRMTETIAMLRDCQESWWANWLQRDYDQIIGRDFNGVINLLGAFGGMGSFNDLVLHPTNNHVLSEEQIGPVNERLHHLRGELFRLANSVKHEVGSV